MPQLSDRCLATRTKNDEILLEGKKIRATFPTSINEGGDAFAYEELIKIYKRSNNNIKNDVRKYLAKVFYNLDSAESYFEKVGIHRSNNSSWKYSKLGDSEEFDEFNIPNVIAQLNEPNYWQTRTTCAIFLKNDKYLRNINAFPQENIERLKEYKWENLFDNLIKNISSDSSLMVRKISLDTYQYWACSLEDTDISTCKDFVKDEIYDFDKVVRHWKIYKKSIMETFRKKLNL